MRTSSDRDPAPTDEVRLRFQECVSMAQPERENTPSDLSVSRSCSSSEKWKAVWLSLFAPSSSGVGRLEIRDSGGGGDHSPGVRRHHQPPADKKVKVIRLSELISVLKLPPNAEACPMENMSAFCVETQDRTLVFSALKEDCVDWVDKLCLCSFQRDSSSGVTQPHMEENQIYASVDEAPQFWVVIQRTEAATRCGLQGSYWLQVGPESLLLRETPKKMVVREWPYELLRRYGSDKLVLTIEAGRRCDCGPGTFLFETQQADKIFSLIKSNIKRKTSPATLGSQIKDIEKVPVVNIRPHSPLPKVPDRTGVASMLENVHITQDRRSPVLDDGGKTQEDSIGPSEAAPAPITLMPLPLIPTHHSSQSQVVYADSNIGVMSDLKPSPVTALYVDPVNVLPLKPPRSEPDAPGTISSEPGLNSDVPDSVYSEVYDKISPDQNKQNILLRVEKPSGEPVYTEPISKTDKGSETRGSPKPDPFAHLYAQVCKAPSRTTATISTASSSNPSEEPQDDVIYENLGII